MKKALALVSSLLLLIAVCSVFSTALAAGQRTITLQSSVLADTTGDGSSGSPYKVQAGTSELALSVANLEQKDWVALYAADHVLNQYGSGYYDYIYPSGYSGQTSFPSNNTGRNSLLPSWPLPNGSYKLVLFENDGYTVNTTVYFDVVGTATGTTATLPNDGTSLGMVADKTTVNAGETITLTLQGDTAGVEFGVFPGNGAGGISAYSPSNYEKLSAGVTSKQVTLNSSGNYVIALWTSGWNFKVQIPVKVNAVTPVGDPEMTVKDASVYVGDPLEFTLNNIGSGLCFGLLKGDGAGGLASPYTWVGYTVLAVDAKEHTYVPTAAGDWVAAVWGDGWDFKVKIPVTISEQPAAEAIQTVYVATTGDDTNAGTVDAPKKTLAAAIAALNGQGTVMIKDSATYDDAVAAYTGTVVIRGENATSTLNAGANGITLQGNTVLADVMLQESAVIATNGYKLNIGENLRNEVKLTLKVKNADATLTTLNDVPAKGLSVGKNAAGQVTVAVNGAVGQQLVADNDSSDQVVPGGNDFVNDDVTVSAHKFNQYANYINYRNPLSNTYKKITQDKNVNVLYFGGSVTAGYGGNIGGWRGITMSWFKATFPDTTFNFTNTAVGESGTFLGTYRLQDDVLSQNPDLIFIEYAINDTYKGSTKEEAALQYETVVRELKAALPNCDIITILVTDRTRAEVLPDLYPTAAGHEEIAAKYGISTINVGAALVDSMTNPADNTEWYSYFLDTVHPKNAGYYAYYKVIVEYLRNSLLYTKHTGVMDNYDVLLPVQSDNLLDGDRNTAFGADMQAYVDTANTSGFTFSTNKYVSHGDVIHNGYYVATSLDSKITFKFTGTEFAFYTNFYNTSQIKYSIDGGAYTTISCHRHAPTQVVTGLASGNHTITIIPVQMGGEAGGEFRIGAIFTRDGAKQSVKGDIDTYADCNRVSFALPAGSWTLTELAAGTAPAITPSATTVTVGDTISFTIANANGLTFGILPGRANGQIDYYSVSAGYKVVSGAADSQSVTFNTAGYYVAAVWGEGWDIKAQVPLVVQAAATSTTTTAAPTTTTVITTTTTEAPTTTTTTTTTTTQPLFKPAAPEAPVATIRLATSLKVLTVAGYEYKLNDGAWQASPTFSGLQPNTTYRVYQRVAATPTSQASDASPAVMMTTRLRGPAAPEAPIATIRMATSLKVLTVAGYQYRLNDGEWQNSAKFTNLKPGTTYRVYQRIAMTDTHNPSDASAPLYITTRQRGPAAPAAPVATIRLATSLKVKTVAGYQYKLDDGEWQNSPKFTNLKPGTTYRIYQRIAQTDTHNPSDASEPLVITTRQRGPAAPAAPVATIRTTNSIKVKTIAGYQYRIEGGEWQDSATFTGLKSGTTYKIYQRVAQTDTHNPSDSSPALIVTTK